MHIYFEPLFTKFTIHCYYTSSECNNYFEKRISLAMDYNSMVSTSIFPFTAPKEILDEYMMCKIEKKKEAPPNIKSIYSQRGDLVNLKTYALRLFDTCIESRIRVGFQKVTIKAIPESEYDAFRKLHIFDNSDIIDFVYLILDDTLHTLILIEQENEYKYVLKQQSVRRGIVFPTNDSYTFNVFTTNGTVTKTLSESYAQ